MPQDAVADRVTIKSSPQKRKCQQKKHEKKKRLKNVKRKKKKPLRNHVDIISKKGKDGAGKEI